MTACTNMLDPLFTIFVLFVNLWKDWKNGLIIQQENG